MLLGVHWLSDVIAGLALGSAWFCVCAIAFGGRLLRFGAPAEEAERKHDSAVAPAAGVSRPTDPVALTRCVMSGWFCASPAASRVAAGG